MERVMLKKRSKRGFYSLKKNYFFTIFARTILRHLTKVLVVIKI